MGIAHSVDTMWDNGPTPGTSAYIPGGIGTGGGELLIACVSFSNSGGPTSCYVADSTNGNWLVAIAPFNSPSTGTYVGMFYMPNSKVTATLDAAVFIGAARSNLAIDVMICSYADPISPLDKTSAIDATGTNPTTSLITPVSNNCLICSFLQPAAHTPAAGSGFTLGITSYTALLADEWQIQSAQSSVAGSWTQAVSEGYAVGIASFLPATVIEQLTYTDQASSSTATIGFGPGSTAGNLLLLGIELTSATDIASVVSVTDDVGNVYSDTGLLAQFSGTVALSMWYCYNSKALSSSSLIHVTASESLNNIHIALREINSCGPINLALSMAMSNISVVGSTLPGPTVIVPQKYSLFSFGDVNGSVTGIQPPFNYDSFDLLESVLNQKSGAFRPTYTLSSGTVGGMIVLAIPELGVSTQPTGQFSSAGNMGMKGRRGFPITG